MLILALKNLKRHKTRTVITVLGIAIGVLLVTIILFTMLSLKRLLVYQFTSSFEPQVIYIMANPQEGTMKTEDLNYMKGLKHVTGVYPAIRLGFIVSPLPNQSKNKDRAFNSHRRAHKGMAINGGTLLAYPDSYYLSTPRIKAAIRTGNIPKNAIPLKSGHAIMAKFFYDQVAKDMKNKTLNVEINPPLELISGLETKKRSENKEDANHSTKIHIDIQKFDTKAQSLYKTAFYIDGFYKAAGDVSSPALYISLNDAKKIVLHFVDSKLEVTHYDDKIGYSLALVKVDDIHNVESVANNIKEHFSNKNFGVITQKDFLDEINKMILILGGTLLFIALFSGIVASLGIINTMVMSVYEQKKEIGILKALGATNGQIFNLYATNAAIIGFLGGVIGILGAVSIFELADSFVVNLLNSQGMDIDRFFVYNILIIMGIAVISALIGFIAGILPALKAAKLDPIKAIRD